MSLVAVRVRELAEGGEDGGRVLLGDARGLRRVSGGVRARDGRNLLIMFLIYCSRRKFTILVFKMLCLPE